MEFIRDGWQSLIHHIRSKVFRVFVMFIITMISAVAEVICGIRSHSNALVADGLYSFAEGICLLGVLLILRWSAKQRYRQKSNNTFGTERLELLFGLIQEVFLLSISLGIIVDAINHITSPSHVHDPKLMIILGGVGIIVGIMGMVMFWGYHHDHDIEEEIQTKKLKTHFLTWGRKPNEGKRQLSAVSRLHMSTGSARNTPAASVRNTPTASARNTPTGSGRNTPTVSARNTPTGSGRNTPTTSRRNTRADASLAVESDTNDTFETKVPSETKPLNAPEYRISPLDAFTYENVEIGESNIYATLHALCLHSFVVLIESVIVMLSGLLIKYIPHVDPITGKEINGWLKYVDPSLTLIMVVIIAIRAIPVILSITELLIENVPAGIDTQTLMKEIVTAVPAIKNIHSLHIWRATAKEIYATLHCICTEDVSLSQCTNKYAREIENIFKNYCVRYFTLQFEYIPMDPTDPLPVYRCVHGLHRKRRGHRMEEATTKLAKEALVNIQ